MKKQATKQATKQTTKQKRRSSEELRILDGKVLTFINAYHLREGFIPTREEIAGSLKLSNLMVAQRSIERLRAGKKLQFQKHSKRGLEINSLVTPQPRFIDLPLLGTVAAGRPIEAIERSENILVPTQMVRGHLPHFVLRVKGDSMIDDHICDGDYVVVRQQPSAENGDRVVALIDNEATLKRFYKKQNQVELHPANEALKPIIVEAHQHLRIAGVYVGLIRMTGS